MGLLEDISRFLETRLEEFIRNNPQIELQILEDKLRQQEEEIAKLIISSKQEEKNLQDRILEIAEEIRVWHDRTVKAESFDRPDLANLAKEREAALLRQGNQIWAQMELVKKRAIDSQALQVQIQERRKEVQVKIAEAAKNAKAKSPTSTPLNWDNLYTPPFRDPDDKLEETFRRWEMDEELERLKRNLGK
ncbi:TIGR04376 family protein [Pseudanabaena sp. FACHB-1998]|uniref:TIGR04376 family protein n=1 Tax=Pseudanabaena sp. FACHB-1998 TaxID=2692858 RepID=UPI0016815443|nr:TIGR04376 family protein [Pseudanabaena sp. FACHB-1998]MBD2176180.1 TIGR04376 family protein [Pseudanabaena sp. FACHB-1998]